MRISFPPRTIRILYIWLAGRTPGEITWLGTLHLLEVEGETILFHLIISYLWICSSLDVNKTPYLYLAVTALSTTPFPSR